MCGMSWDILSIYLFYFVKGLVNLITSHSSDVLNIYIYSSLFLWNIRVRVITRTRIFRRIFYIRITHKLTIYAVPTHHFKHNSWFAGSRRYTVNKAPPSWFAKHYRLRTTRTDSIWQNYQRKYSLRWQFTKSEHGRNNSCCAASEYPQFHFITTFSK